MKKTCLCLATLLFAVFTGCRAKQAAQPSEPPPSIISHQGSAAGFSPIDKSRAASAQTYLSGDPELAQLRLQVNVFNDTATLTGTVQTEEQKSKAEMLVKRTPGILKVENQLQVSP